MKRVFFLGWYRMVWFRAAFCLAVAGNVWGEGPIERLEPGHWWTGMAWNELQILVYGDAVAELEAVVEAPGVQLVRTVRVPNRNYLFLYLDVSRAVPGAFEIRFEAPQGEVFAVPYELKERGEGSAERAGFGPEDVLYLITPDRFANGNLENDAVEGMADRPARGDPQGRHGGDLAGIRNHMDYFADLGVTALWLNPVLENDMPRASYHGYAATDLYRVDPRLGSLEGYRQLVAEARERGLKVIMDLILNHVGSEHWFAKDPPTPDWIHFGGNFIPTNHRRTTHQDPHASAHDTRRFVEGWFVETMPDLNQREPLLADYLIQNSIWWVEEVGLAGIRMDTYPYPDRSFMADWTCALMAEYPNFNIVGEEWSLQPAIVAYWQRGKDNHDDYRSCLPSLMDFPFQSALARSLTDTTWRYDAGFPVLYETLALDFLYADPYALVVFPDNHDMDRFFTQVGEDPALFRMGLATVLTMRGVPQLYYGTEILMDNAEAPGDHGVIRTDFPGGWPGDPVNAFTGEGLKSLQIETRDWLRRLLHWRRETPVLHHGRFMHFAPEEGVYVFFRYDEQNSVMVALNRGERAVELRTDRFAERLQGYRHARDPLTEAELTLGPFLSVPPRSVRILELMPSNEAEETEK